MDAQQIALVRRFNRLITQRVGALDDSYLQRGRPLGEARMIYEIGPAGREVGELRRVLGLDSGYASRLLRSLEAQGLAQVMASATDRRRREARLTAKGLAEHAAYDRRSDALAESILAPLDVGRRERLTSAMAEVERLLRAASIEVRLEPVASADARWCLESYFRELAARFEHGFDPGEGDAATGAEMSPPHGFFVIARLDGRPVGCGGLKVMGPGLGEIKRVWTAEEARRMGVAARIMAALEDEARRWGLATVRLDTNRALAEAQALYPRLGYRKVARFNDNPYADHWFEKAL
ncbi:bifunctional helix-turn-helix transcriptional regulator/GNAT family N-acetyltransferase [Phenylobacterium montanum]|uniref:MarR family transcriptional regulator n=1 Tax=Phenylobacterium montanum TaxID=2823693 RepID=A0A975ITL6_9CAUL|nr:helix-turn-helix domain-containing GNAT family N-acetyltransferase [Caulobacter sp. S6]QUD86865.1 MarR family transcriptional regulator [Caulobacter sp. S6]